jgi:DUF2075 family protein
VQRVFRKTSGLAHDMVLSPFDVGLSEERFNLLIVDETHRLNHRANQPSGMQNQQFTKINERLFGYDDTSITQLDWIRKQSDHQVFLLDAAQTVRPADLPATAIESLLSQVEVRRRVYPLSSQLRVQGGADYITYVKQMLIDQPPQPTSFGDYDFRLFDNLADMTSELVAREQELGLARLVAGYAWQWRSKRDKTAYDIEIDGVKLRWNTTPVDWVNSPTAGGEVGSIHTIQGYDLNYAGVIIGRDLRWDSVNRRMRFDRSNYFDKKGMENNRRLGVSYDDEDLLRFVTNIYAVLLTRGIKGTYVYVCDKQLREHLRPLIPPSHS